MRAGRALSEKLKPNRRLGALAQWRSAEANFVHPDGTGHLLTS